MLNQSGKGFILDHPLRFNIVKHKTTCTIIIQELFTRSIIKMNYVGAQTLLFHLWESYLEYLL